MTCAGQLIFSNVRLLNSYVFLEARYLNKFCSKGKGDRDKLSSKGVKITFILIVVWFIFSLFCIFSQSFFLVVLIMFEIIKKRSFVLKIVENLQHHFSLFREYFLGVPRESHRFVFIVLQNDVPTKKIRHLKKKHNILTKVNSLHYYGVDVRGVQGVQLHPSIFEEDLYCTHQF